MEGAMRERASTFCPNASKYFMVVERTVTASREAEEEEEGDGLEVLRVAMFE